LSGLFFVSTIGAYAAYARRPFSLARYLAVAVLFALGLLAKPTLVTLPFVLLLLDYWPLGRWRPAAPGESDNPGDPEARRYSLSRLVVEKIPLLLLSVGGCASAVLSEGDNIASLESLSIPVRIANALNSYAVYVGQFFWPAGLAIFYPRSESPPAWQVAGACLVLAACSVAAVVLWRKQSAVLVGWLWYLGMLVPVIGIVPIGAHARADRYTYLPDIGLSIALVWGAGYAMDRLLRARAPARRLSGAAGALAVVVLMACAWQQTRHWRNSETLWTHTLSCTSRNLLAHKNFGAFLEARGRTDEAIAQYRQALEIKRDDALANYNLGNALAAKGQIDAAIEHYRKALEMKPDYAEAHHNLGFELAGRGQVDEAIARYEKALQIKPDFLEAHYNLGLALADRGQRDEALGHYRKALDLATARDDKSRADAIRAKMKAVGGGN
jgi:Tfp pilus assembly protein PilF